MDLRDAQGRTVRLTEERLAHIESDHPEMAGQLDRIRETLASPERVVRSGTDESVELFHRLYSTSPVTRKFLCVVVKAFPRDRFVLTAYYTDAVKAGDLIWERK